MAALSHDERVVYVVRHAESRYNDAKRRWGLVGLVGETDHGLSTAGVEQCAVLRSAITTAAARGDADGEAIMARGATLSSPLTRAILTAHLALPLRSNSDSSGSGGSGGGGGDSAAEAVAHACVALADAREHCLMPLFARDSVGTHREGIGVRVAEELAALDARFAAARDAAAGTPGGGTAAAAHTHAHTHAVLPEHLCRPGALDVDTSRVAEDKWWVVGERHAAVVARLGALAWDLFDASGHGGGKVSDGGSGGGATVLVAHSRVIRTLIQEYGDCGACGEGAGEGGAALVRELGERLVDNCAVLRLTLKGQLRGQEGGQEGDRTPATAPRVIRAAFLFGTGFKQ